ncbi:MAG: orotate phosphoribosyltransferase, partial [Nannocystaceae bacterium]
MESFQKDFIELLVRYEVLRFGEFTLKSGRTSPYFVNAGQLRTGRAIAGVGAAYAAVIDAQKVPCDLVFGPAYKGVPLAVATATALSSGSRDVPFGFDRKEVKDHGEGGQFVGTRPAAGMRVVLVDDVITSGLSLREAATLLTSAADVEVSAAIVAVDRQERGRGGDKTTLEELRDDLGIRVLPIVTIREVVQYLHGREIDGAVVLDDAKRQAIETYLA